MRYGFAGYSPEATQPDSYEADFQLETLRRARLYLVTEDMGQLLAAAEPSLPSFDLNHEDVPASDGLVVLDPPLDLPLTFSGNEGSVAAFSWSVMETADTGKPGVNIVLWGIPDAFDGDRVPLGADVPSLIPHCYGVWWFHERWQPIPEEGGYQSWPAYIATFWRLIVEPYVGMEQTRPGRAVSRRAQRAKIADPTIRVVILRRSKGAAVAADQHVNWSRRWIVQGHWRRQWYPSQGRHAPRWIHPYLKGPEDKPLFPPQTVNVWSR